MNISHAIRFLRKQKGWTQQQLADFSNTSKSNISNLENGNQGYSESILQYLASAFNCPVSHIFILAELIEKQNDKKDLDWDAIPLDVLVLQLPAALQESLKGLVVEMLNKLAK
jgi:putative helix-turn-helix protein